MSSRVRFLLSAFAASAFAAASFSLVGAAPAGAVGQETFGCRLSPGSATTYQGICANSRPSGRYDATFALGNTSGVYSLSWAISGRYQSVVRGCTSTSTECVISLPGSSSDSQTSVTVAYSQDGQTATRSATAVVYRFCGTVYC